MCRPPAGAQLARPTGPRRATRTYSSQRSTAASTSGVTRLGGAALDGAGDSSSSAAAPDRGALLGECPRAFDRVLGVDRGAVAGESGEGGHRVADRQGAGAAIDVEDRGDREWRGRGDLGR